jgi:hypothetical protein
MMDNLDSHPAVVMWILFNEGWGQYDTERLTKWVRERDPSRLVNNASGSDAGVGHVYDAHDYRFHTPIAQPGQLGDRAMLLGECGGFNVTVPGHTWEDYPIHAGRIDEIGGGVVRESYRDGATWENRYAAWVDNLRLLRGLGLCGAVYTQITDVEHELNGWLTYDRRISKIPAERLKALHQRLSAPPALKPIVPMRAGRPGDRRQGDEPRVQRTFTIEKVPGRVAVCVAGAGRARVYLNGQLVKQFSNGGRKNYVPVSMAWLAPESLKALHPGSNELVVELSAPAGPPSPETSRFIDAGLFEFDE